MPLRLPVKVQWILSEVETEAQESTGKSQTCRRLTVEVSQLLLFGSIDFVLVMTILYLLSGRELWLQRVAGQAPLPLGIMALGWELSLRFAPKPSNFRPMTLRLAAWLIALFIIVLTGIVIGSVYPQWILPVL